jgi:hypothetical protein
MRYLGVFYFYSVEDPTVFNNAIASATAIHNERKGDFYLFFVPPLS